MVINCLSKHVATLWVSFSVRLSCACLGNKLDRMRAEEKEENMMSFQKIGEINVI